MFDSFRSSIRRKAFSMHRNSMLRPRGGGVCQQGTDSTGRNVLRAVGRDASDMHFSKAYRRKIKPAVVPPFEATHLQSPVMQMLRNSRFLARLVMAWFMLTLGIAVASPIVHPQAMEVVCTSSGS